MSTFRFFSFIFVVSSCLATTSSAYRMLHVKHSQIKKSSVWGASTRRIAAVRPLLAAEENKESDFPSMFQGSAATDKTSETSDKPLVSRYKNLNYGEEVEVKWRDPVRKKKYNYCPLIVLLFFLISLLQSISCGLFLVFVFHFAYIFSSWSRTLAYSSVISSPLC